MKNLAKLNGAKALSKKEQKVVNGGGTAPCMEQSLRLGQQCCGGVWVNRSNPFDYPCGIPDWMKL